MENINSRSKLKESIQLLELRQIEDKRMLKEQFLLTYESMKPMNMIKKSIKDMVTSSDHNEGLLQTTLGLAAGYLSKKAAVGSSQNPLRQLLGALVQLGVTNVVSKNTGGLKPILIRLISSYLNKRKASGDNEEKAV